VARRRTKTEAVRNASTWLATLTFAGQRFEGFARLSGTNRAPRCFGGGCSRYDPIPNTPEDRLLPLIDGFIEYTSRNSVVALALSFA